MTDDELIAPITIPSPAIRDKPNVDYGIAYDNLLNAANAKLKRSLKDGFRMEGSLSSASLRTYLPADGIVIALRASGD